MNYLQSTASHANQTQSRLIKLLFVFRQRVQDNRVGAPACSRLSSEILPESRVQLGAPVPQRSRPTLLSCTLRQPLLTALTAFGFNCGVLAGGMLATAPVVRDAAGGQALAAQIRCSMPEENLERHGVFVIKSGKKKTEIPFLCQVKLHPGTWETIYQAEATAVAGAERLVIIHSTNGPNQYLYARAPKPGAPLPEPSPVPPTALEAPFAGTDFSLGELGLEFLHWPGQCRLNSEMREGQSCYVLESTNSQKAGIVRVKSSIDEKSFGPIYAEAYDSGGKEIKEFSLDSMQKDAHGQYQVKEMGIDDLKARSHTDVRFDMPKAQ